MINHDILKFSLIETFKKLNPKIQIKNPVMFVVYIGSIITTCLYFHALNGKGEAPAHFILMITLWLWLTVLFANFAESVAEGKSKAQALSLRGLKKTVFAKKLKSTKREAGFIQTPSTELKPGDVILVEAKDIVPSDGEVVEGIAAIDESAITGESAPVIRSSGGDFSFVTGGTRIISDWIVVRITANPGETFIDKMIAMVENAKRRKTPNEIALTILLCALTLSFLLCCATLLPFSLFSVELFKAGLPITITVLISLLVCLIPTTIGGLLSAIGIAGMSRVMQANVIVTSGRAVEAAGDIDILLLDKTGTITIGHRAASGMFALEGVDEKEFATTALLASLSDDTPEGQSITAFIKNKFPLSDEHMVAEISQSILFSAQTRMSGIDLKNGTEIRKGAGDRVIEFVKNKQGQITIQLQNIVDTIARRGSTPIVVAKNNKILGVIELKDIVKPHIKERFEAMHRMGIKTIMITGDNPITAAAIAAEAGVDDFLAEATPEKKLALIRQYQAQGKMVAMTGDGTNDAPALAQADVAVAMNSGTQAAREAGNMVDLDSDPTKLIEIVEIGKQMLMTRGALTTFSIANDVAKYFAIIPAAFVITFPKLSILNVMHLTTPSSAILSAVIFNALIIIFLVPLALKGVKYHAIGAGELLRRHLWIYGLGGLVTPFIGIKLIDTVLMLL